MSQRTMLGSSAREVRNAGRRLLRRGKYLLGNDPAFLPVLLRLTPLGLSRQITEHTDMVVEGFPRAGNTFTAFALQDATHHRLNIASHVHHPAQVKQAVRRGVPVLLVVREPIATLSSYLVFGKHGRASRVLLEYASYHRQLTPYVDQLVICDFREATSDLSAVIARLNQRFGLHIPAFDQSAENVEYVFDEIARHHALVHSREDPDSVVPRPMAAREAMTQQRRAELLDPRNAARLADAERIYDFFVTKAVQQRSIFERLLASEVPEPAKRPKPERMATTRRDRATTR
jgi:hypothetical protein